MLYAKENINNDGENASECKPNQYFYKGVRDILIAVKNFILVRLYSNSDAVICEEQKEPTI